MSSLDQALDQLKQGKMIILVDDEEREKEGDLVLAADFEKWLLARLILSHARGLICLALEPKQVEYLQLEMMTSKNKSSRQTPFTVSIEAKKGVTTGISAPDRAHTIQVAVTQGPDDLVSPGHIFPLKAQEGGILVRAGHTEGSIDLMKMAGLNHSAVICEIMKEDGTMARFDDLKIFAKQHQLPIISIKEST